MHRYSQAATSRRQAHALKALAQQPDWANSTKIGVPGTTLMALVRKGYALACVNKEHHWTEYRITENGKSLAQAIRLADFS